MNKAVQNAARSGIDSSNYFEDYLRPMLKIVITGPESTGKTTLANALGQHFQVPVVEEFAREYLDGLDRPYVEDDLLQIAIGQSFSEDKARGKAGRMIICDTDMLTLRIWSKAKYGQFLKPLNPLWFDDLPHLYLVCSPDIPWEPDPQRESPEDRDALFDMYIAEIERAKVNYAVIKGEERTEQGIRLVEEFVEHVDTQKEKRKK